MSGGHTGSGTTAEPTEARASPPPRWWAYELTMAALALVAIWLLTLPEDTWVRAANLAIWAVFVVDYGVRFTRAPDRRRFVRAHVPELISILPLDFLRVARLARLFRLLRLVRALSVLWRVSRDARGVLGTNGLGWLLGMTTVLVLGGGFAIARLEDEIDSVGDGIWWAMVTATTVGYGDLAPTTHQGRGIAAVLMLFGIGTLAMVTGSIATYFLGHGRQEPTNRQVVWIRGQLDEWDSLPPTDRRQLAAMLTALADADADRDAEPEPRRATSGRPTG